MKTCFPILLLVFAQVGLFARPGHQGNYFVLTAKHNQPAPFGTVRFTYGPTEKSGQLQWSELEVRSAANFDTPPLFSLRVLTEEDPLAGTKPLHVERYILQVPETGEVLEYRDVHTGKALLPAWADFERYFLPHAATGAQREHGLPQTCEFLGHVLTLHHTHTNAAWKDWPAPKLLNLDRELLIGTSRPFRDSEGHRLPQQPERHNYNYVPFTADDYRVMIDTGINLYCINPNQEQWVRSEPVFYLRSAGGKPTLRYPVDLYRANYIGTEMFMDEPSILTVGDTNIHRTLKYFSDAAAVIEKRTHAVYESASGVYNLEKGLLGLAVNLGELRLRQFDIPSWETLYDTAFYQMKGGGTGIVHEGRYQLADFDKAVARFTGQSRKHTPEELLQYHYAFLRGAVRPFNKFWGTAIYGQCDTNIAPLALTLAYDMGARYLWFWTSDHDHHVPWPEQLTLVRHLRAHTQAHPRPSIYQPPQPVDVAIVIPYGYFLSLENLWWIRVLDKEGKNEASQKYQRLMQRAFMAVHNCFDQHLTFDITVEDAKPITGYGKLIRITDSD